jgi:hypothetical protein
VVASLARDSCSAITTSSRRCNFGLDRGVWSVVLYGIFQIAPVIAELIRGERVERVFRLVDGQWFGRHRQRAPHGKAVT